MVVFFSTVAFDEVAGVLEVGDGLDTLLALGVGVGDGLISERDVALGDGVGVGEGVGVGVTTSWESFTFSVGAE